MTTYLNTSDQIASALRAMAFRLDTIPDMAMPGMAVSLNVQASRFGEVGPRSRISTVNALTEGLLYTSAATFPYNSSGLLTHKVPYTSNREVGGVTVSIFTVLPSLDELWGPARVAGVR
jgi:hypothetical protein